jgi:hemoglobin
MTLASEKMDHVSEDGIRQLVDAFYTKVRADSELGPIFEHKIKDNWPPHLEKMYAFWSSVMLTTGRYKGNPMMKHMVIPGLKPELFTQWLALFDQTCGELYDEPIRAAFMEKAERIAESLKIGVFYRPDRPWPPQASAGPT